MIRKIINDKTFAGCVLMGLGIGYLAKTGKLSELAVATAIKVNALSSQITATASQFPSIAANIKPIAALAGVTPTPLVIALGLSVLFTTFIVFMYSRQAPEEEFPIGSTARRCEDAIKNMKKNGLQCTVDLQQARFFVLGYQALTQAALDISNGTPREICVAGASELANSVSKEKLQEWITFLVNRQEEIQNLINKR